MMSLLCHQTSEHQHYWDTLYQPLTYAYNTQTHVSTQTTLLTFVLKRKPPAGTELARPSPFSSHQKSALTARDAKTALSASTVICGQERERQIPNFGGKIKQILTDWSKTYPYPRKVTSSFLIKIHQRGLQKTKKCTEISKQRKQNRTGRKTTLWRNTVIIGKQGILDTVSTDILSNGQRKDKNEPPQAQKEHAGTDRSSVVQEEWYKVDTDRDE